MTVAERAARGATDRTVPPRVASHAKKAWQRRAERLEDLGMQLIEKGSKLKPMTTRANGLQMRPEFSAGRGLLADADKLWARLGRVTPPGKGRTDGTNGNEAATGDDLAAYAKTKKRKG